MEKIGEILENQVARGTIKQKFSERMALLFWYKICGEKLSEHTEAVFMRNGRLVVRVENSVWAQELNFHKQDLIRRLNDAIGEKVVDDIRFKTGSLSTERTEKREKTPAFSDFISEEELSEEQVDRIEKWCGNIPDENLKEKFRMFLQAVEKRKNVLERSGGRRCRFCGTVFLDEEQSEENKSKKEELCLVCRISLNKSRIKDLKDVLKDIPWLSYEQSCQMVRGLLFQEYTYTREKFIKELETEIERNFHDLIEKEQSFAGLKETEPAALFKKLWDLVQTYVMLKETLNPTEVDDCIIASTIGKYRYKRLQRYKGGLEHVSTSW